MPKGVLYQDHTDPLDSSDLWASPRVFGSELSVLSVQPCSPLSAHGPALLLISAPSISGSSADLITVSFFPHCR